MILIIGLGNPGKKFEKTSHNLGFLVLDYFKRKNDFGPWQNKRMFQAKISQKEIAFQKVILAKPQTFMNDSGQAVKELAAYYKLPSQNIWIIHDDLALNWGKIKISQARGAAGHKGVQSIIDQLGNKNFLRLRIGIKPPPGIKQDWKVFVLKKISASQEQGLKQIKEQADQALKTILERGTNQAMNLFN